MGEGERKVESGRWEMENRKGNSENRNFTLLIFSKLVQKNIRHRAPHPGGGHRE